MILKPREAVVSWSRKFAFTRRVSTNCSLEKYLSMSQCSQVDCDALVIPPELIEEAKNLGLRTIVSDQSESCSCRGLADIFVPIDIFDADAHIAFHDSNLAHQKLK